MKGFTRLEPRVSARVGSPDLGVVPHVDDGTDHQEHEVREHWGEVERHARRVRDNGLTISRSYPRKCLHHF